MTDQTQQPWLDSPIVSAPAAQPWMDAPLAVVTPSSPSQSDPALRDHFEGALSAAKEVNKDADGNQKDLSYWDALKIGYSHTASSMMDTRKLPQEMPADASAGKQTAAFLANVIGDLPSAITGSAIGGAAGAETGPGAAVTAMGGAFAFPTVLRGVLMDGIMKDHFDSPKEAIQRATGILLDTAKAYVQGGAAAVGGIGTAAAIPEVLTGLAAKGAISAGEMTAAVAANSAMEGRLPSKQDVYNAAALLAGGHIAGHVIDRVVETYKRTGIMPAQIVQDAKQDPSILDDMLSVNKEIPDAYKTLVDSKQTAAEPTPPNTEPTEEMKSMIAMRDYGGKNPSAPFTFDSWYRNWVDKNSRVKDLTNQMSEDPIPTAQDPHSMLQLSSGSRQQMFIERGTFEFGTNKVNGESLADILKPVQGNTKQLFGFMDAEKTVEKAAQGIDTGYDLDKAKQTIKDYKGQFEETAQKVVDWQNKGVQYAYDGGYISKESRDLMIEMNKKAIPMNVVMDDVATQANGGGKVFSTMKGSDKLKTDPLAAMIKNLGNIIQKTDRNAASLAYVDAALKSSTPEAFAVKVKTPVRPIEVTDDEMSRYLKAQGVEPTDDALTIFRAERQQLEPDQMAVYRDGQREVWQVNPDVALAFKGSDAGSMAAALKINSAITSWTRAGIILDPSFGLKHIFRQQITAFVQSKNGYIPFVTALRGAAVYFGKDGDNLFERYMMSGGGMASIIAGDRENTQFEADKIRGDSIFGTLKNAQANPWSLLKLPYNVVRSPYDMMRLVTHFDDTVTRLGEFKQAIDLGKTDAEAALDSRNVTADYMRSGLKGQFLNKQIAFFNMRIQGPDLMIRALRDQVDAAPEGAKAGIVAKHVGGAAAKAALDVAQIAAWGKITSGIIIPTLVLWFANKNDSRIQDMSDHDKHNYWFFPTDDWRAPEKGVDGHLNDDPTTQGMQETRSPDLIRYVNGEKQYNYGIVYKIPKPQETGMLIATSLESFMDYTMKHDPAAVGRFFKDLWSELGPSIIPTTAVGPMEILNNKNYATGGPLIPPSLQDVLPEFQYTGRTTELAKRLGSMVGQMPYIGKTFAASPIAAETLLRTFGGTSAMTILQTADEALKASGVFKVTNPEKTLADLPVTKSFVAHYGPDASAQPIQDAYENIKAQQVTMNSLRLLAKTGKPEAATAFANANAASMMDLQKAAEAMRKGTDYIHYITNNPDFSPHEQMRLTNYTYYGILSVAKQVNAAVAAQAEAMKKGLGSINPTAK